MMSRSEGAISADVDRCIVEREVVDAESGLTGQRKLRSRRLLFLDTILGRNPGGSHALAGGDGRIAALG